MSEEFEELKAQIDYFMELLKSELPEETKQEIYVCIKAIIRGWHSPQVFIELDERPFEM